MSVRRGRRPGSPDTRARILDVARRRFAEAGYAGTSVRGIAAEASVDSALVHHYFGTKEELFLAALAVPADPREVLAPVVAGGLEGAGARLLEAILGVWDDEERRLPLLALVRGVADPGGQQYIRDGFLQIVLGQVGVGLALDQPERRMALVASQLMGLILLRYVLEIEPLASAPRQELVATYAPTLQRYLADPLP